MGSNQPYEPPALETIDCAELVKAIDDARLAGYDEEKWDSLEPHLAKIQAVLTLAPIGFKVIQELDKLWGIDNLVDVNVEEPDDYLLVLGHLVDLARKTALTERALGGSAAVRRDLTVEEIAWFRRIEGELVNAPERVSYDANQQWWAMIPRLLAMAARTVEAEREVLEYRKTCVQSVTSYEARIAELERQLTEVRGERDRAGDDAAVFAERCATLRGQLAESERLAQQYLDAAALPSEREVQLERLLAEAKALIDELRPPASRHVLEERRGTARAATIEPTIDDWARRAAALDGPQLMSTDLEQAIWSLIPAQGGIEARSLTITLTNSSTEHGVCAFMPRAFGTGLHVRGGSLMMVLQELARRTAAETKVPCMVCEGVGWFGKPGKISQWCTACGGSGHRRAPQPKGGTP